MARNYVGMKNSHANAAAGAALPRNVQIMLRALPRGGCTALRIFIWTLLVSFQYRYVVIFTIEFFIFAFVFLFYSMGFLLTYFGILFFNNVFFRVLLRQPLLLWSLMPILYRSCWSRQRYFCCCFELVYFRRFQAPIASSASWLDVRVLDKVNNTPPRLSRWKTAGQFRGVLG